jgi:hypothetical protein
MMYLAPTDERTNRNNRFTSSALSTTDREPPLSTGLQKPKFLGGRPARDAALASIFIYTHQRRESERRFPEPARGVAIKLPNNFFRTDLPSEMVNR